MDFIFTIKKDGTIEGVSTVEKPVKLLVKFYPKSTWNGHIESVILLAGKNQIKLPDCILKLFMTQKFQEIIASGSGNFLQIDFNDAGFDKSRQGNRGYRVEFDTRTWKITRIYVNVINCNGFTNYIPLNIKQLCSSIDIQQLLDSKY